MNTRLEEDVMEKWYMGGSRSHRESFRMHDDCPRVYAMPALEIYADVPHIRIELHFLTLQQLLQDAIGDHDLKK